MARRGGISRLSNALPQNWGPIQILLVEDDPYDTLLILETLEANHHYRVRAVEDGAQALVYLEGQRHYFNDPMPDLILLDLKLPRMNGLDLLAEIKSDERFQHIPAIVLTNSSLDEDIHRSYALHANAYVQKPLNPVQFRNAIRQTLDFWLNVATIPHG